MYLIIYLNIVIRFLLLTFIIQWFILYILFNFYIIDNIEYNFYYY